MIDMDSMTYSFVLTGRMPALIHHDDVEQADELTRWRKDKKNKELSKAGDDRSPPWTWQTYLYHDGKTLVVPQENIMRCLGKAGTRIPKPNSRGTFKELSQSALMIPNEYCEFHSNGRPVPLKPIADLAGLPFAEQAAGVKRLGFELKVKRAAVGQSKHVRVRAMFRSWSVSGIIIVLEPAIITADILAEHFDVGGRTIGLFDWRPSSPKSPGPYGTFTSKVELLKSA